MLGIKMKLMQEGQKSFEQTRDSIIEALNPVFACYSKEVGEKMRNAVADNVYGLIMELINISKMYAVLEANQDVIDISEEEVCH